MKMSVGWMSMAAGLVLVGGLCGRAAWFSENFATDPASRGWRAVGDSSLFHWNATNQQVEVTWDSRRTNSYYCRSLGTVLSRTNSFCLVCDLRMSDWTPGVDPQQTLNTWPSSVGLVNLAAASGTNFWRGTGSDSPDLVEFSFFPDPGGAWQWGPSLTAVLVDSAATNWSHWVYCTSFDGLSAGDAYRVVMTYTAADQTLRTLMTRNGQPFSSFPDGTLGAEFTDFRVDHVAVCSYSGAVQPPGFPGSLLAHGTVSRLALTPPPLSTVTCTISNGLPQAQFLSAPFWSYRLERTTNFTAWALLPAVIPGTGGVLSLLDTNPPAGRAFYRVRAELP